MERKLTRETWKALEDAEEWESLRKDYLKMASKATSQARIDDFLDLAEEARQEAQKGFAEVERLEKESGT